MTAIPLPAGTDVGETIDNKLFGRSILFDEDGNDIGGALLARATAVLAAVNGLEGALAPAATATKQDAIKASIDALAPLLDGVEGLLNAIGAAITGATYYPATQSISAAALPLPTGAATDAKVEAVRALLAGTLAVSAAALPLPAGAATAAKQDAQKASLDLTAPAEDLFAIVPSDGADLATIPKALLCTVAGDIVIRGAGGTSVNVKALQGQIIPVRARRVLATGTTGTVVGLV